MSLDGLEEEPLVLSADEMERMSPSKNSLSSSIDFISSALKRMGISDSLNLLSNDPQHVVETCNAIYGLLLQHEKDIEYKETLKKEVLESRRLLQIEKKERTKLGSLMDSKEREVAGLAQKALTKDANWKDQAAKAKREAEDLQKRLLGSERKAVQMRHEIKRKENEYERLQRRLSKYLADNRKAESAVLDLAGQVSKGFAKSPVKQRQLYQDDNLRTVVTAYESKQAEYKKEIEELRAALMTLQKEHSEALNTVAERRRDPKETVRIVDDEFIQAVPNMSANELRAELTSKIKTLQKRLNSLDWHASHMTQESIQLTIREHRLCEDLSSARIVLHDQEALITSVLVALKSALSNTEKNYESKLREKRQMYEEKISALHLAIREKEDEFHASLSSQMQIVKDEYEGIISEEKRQKKEMQEQIDSLESRIETMERKHEASMETYLEKVKQEHEAKLAKVNADAETTMAAMASESSEIQLSLKREHAGFRAEASALREKVLLERANREALEAAMNAKIDEAFAAGQTRGIMTIEEMKKNHEAAMKEQETAYATRVQDLLREKAAFGENQETVELEKQHLEQQISQLTSSLKQYEERIDQLTKEIQSITMQRSADLAQVMEKSERESQTERNELVHTIEMLKSELKSTESALAEKDSTLKSILAKESEASSLIFHYEEMTQYYKKLMSKYAPGLGAGTFLEKAIQRKATACAN